MDDDVGLSVLDHQTGSEPESVSTQTKIQPDKIRERQEGTSDEIHDVCHPPLQ
jgi:hypothetical protein